MSKVKRSLTDQEDLCARFKESLDFLGLKPSNAYEKLGYSTPSTLYSVIAGRCLPDLTRLLELSRLTSPSGYRINIDWLVTGAGPKGVPHTEEVDRNIIEELLVSTPKEKLDAIVTLID